MATDVDDSEPLELFADYPPDTLSSKTFGFWLYMLGDTLMFTALFVAYGVLEYRYAGGPTAADVDQPFHVLFETCLLYTGVCAMSRGMQGMARNDRAMLGRWFGVTLVAGLIFIGMEVYDFSSQVNAGIMPTRSAYLSIYFTLVAAHGLHVVVGVLWMLVMIIQVWIKGFSSAVVQRLLNLEIFWLFQGFIWACVFTFVDLWSASS